MALVDTAGRVWVSHVPVGAGGGQGGKAGRTVGLGLGVPSAWVGVDFSPAFN